MARSHVLNFRVSDEQLALVESKRQELNRPSIGDTAKFLCLEACRSSGVYPSNNQVSSSTEPALLERLSALYFDITAKRISIGDDDFCLVGPDEAMEFALTNGTPALRNTLYPRIHTLIKKQVEIHGWFFPAKTQELLTVLNSISLRTQAKPDYDFSNLSHTGNKFIRENFKSYWSVVGGPVESTQLADVMFDAFDAIMFKNNSKLSFRNIRKFFVENHNSVSYFKPATASDIYSTFLSGKVKPVTWDPSGGFGGRMLGFAAAISGGTYLANEPANQTRQDLILLADRLPEANTYHVTKQGSEVWSPDADSVDLTFTSPPYYTKELYFREPTQSWVKFPDILTWKIEFLFKTLDKAWTATKTGGHIVYNVDRILGRMIEDWITTKPQKIKWTKGGLKNRKLGRSEVDRMYVEPIYVIEVQK